MISSLIKYLIILCIQGNLFFMIYLIVLPFAKTKLNSKWLYGMLKINCLFFLFPIGMIIRNIGLEKSMEIGGLVNNPVPKVVEDIINVSTSANQNTIANENGIFNLTNIIFIIWLAGAVLFFAYNFICLYKLHRDINKLSEVKDVKTLEIFNDIKKEQNITRDISLYWSDVFSSPLVIGIFKTKIFLPKYSYSEPNLRFIFSHELTHVRRHDLFFKYLLLAIETIYWFNPLVYFFRKEFEKRLEYSCDESVAMNLSFDQRKKYGLSIIESSIINKPLLHRFHYGLRFASNKKQLEKRLSNMLNLKKMSNGKKVLAGALAIGLLAGGTISAYAATETPNELANLGIQTTDINDSSLIKDTKDETTAEVLTYQKEETTQNAKLDLEMPLSETNQRATSSINWNVPNGKLAYGGNLSMEAGETITINVAISPMNKTVQVGIIEPGGTFRYVNAKGSANHTFSIKKRGVYKIAINNASGSNISVSGFIKY